MSKAVAPKSIDRRDRPVPVRLPIEVQLFYEAQGAFVREATLTRTMEQFLIARAGVADNKKELAAAIQVRAMLLNKTPKDLILELLEEKGYGEFLNLDTTAEALCLAWGIEEIKPKS